MDLNYKLPKYWNIVVSSKIMDIRDGTHDTPKYVTQNGVPLITSKNLKENKIDFEKVSLISEEDHVEISKRSKVEEGDILFAMIGTIGNPAIIKGGANFSIKNVGLFKKNESVIIPEFFVNFLRSNFFEKQLNERKLLKGTTQKFIPLGNLRNINIPLPPLKTQKLIVSKIEELFSELDKGIENLKTAQQQLKVYRQSVLKCAFEGKLTNKNVKEGELPKGWKWVNFGEIFSESPQNGVYKSSTEYGNGTPIIRIDSFYDGTILDGFDCKRVRLNKEEIIRYKISVGDILVNRVNSMPYLGKCGIVKHLKEETVFESNIMKITINKAIAFPEYLSIYLSSKRGLTELRKNAKQAVNQASINQTDVSNALIPLPAIDEQRHIVIEIEDRLSIADKMNESINQSLQQAEALRQSILKKAFEGKLV